MIILSIPDHIKILKLTQINIDKQNTQIFILVVLNLLY